MLLFLVFVVWAKDWVCTEVVLGEVGQIMMEESLR